MNHQTSNDQASPPIDKEILSNAPDAIVIITPEGICQYANMACKRILGFEPEWMIGKNLLEMIHPAEAPDINMKQEDLLKTPGAIQTAVYRFQRSDGGFAWLEAIAVNHLETPGIHGILIFTRDVTNMKQAGEESVDRVRELETLVQSMTGRELRMTEMKEEIEELKKRLGESDK